MSASSKTRLRGGVLRPSALPVGRPTSPRRLDWRLNMVDISTFRRGDIVRGRFSRKRYRVICANRHEVYVVNARLRRFRPNKAFWLGAHEFEVI